ncbi:LPS export ABC transporter periplasmic protein LptC [Zavarzinia compransoris]|uniref:LPS export ABC transporter periplasmic protein LptC n=1 Tax=Zavarzinia marina TaxID=2911065 RepID=UPI001F267157|nr:LPS export ABC transporter periplasmic protein LptC [Zavarzinia marina]MCF4166028.1 LPS export ABC transporter periplasmic protein LptC [Zavarzinia marina]
MARRSPFPDRARAAAPTTGRVYSRFVGLMKVVLPLVALALLAAVLIWPSIDSRRDLGLSYEDMEIRADGLEMVEPILTGVDDRGRPYVIAAKGATADGLEPTQVTLRDIEADLAMEDDKPVKVVAATGLYRIKEETLRLDGGVTVSLSDGHTVDLDSVLIDLAKGTASSDKRVVGSGPSGRIEADGMNASDGGHVLRFEGNVRAVITRGEP